MLHAGFEAGRQSDLDAAKKFGTKAGIKKNRSAARAAGPAGPELLPKMTFPRYPSDA
jgi:hypothetical protein